MRLSLIAMLLSGCCACGQSEKTSKAADVAPLQVTKADGGSITTDLGYGIAVNKGSSLRRLGYGIIDPSGPVTALREMTIRTQYKDRSYAFKCVGEAVFSKPIAAVEIVHLLFDVFGNHQRSLRNLSVKESPPGASLECDGEWYASENDVSEYLTAISYVRTVRLNDGTLWRTNMNAVYKTVQGIIPDLKREAIDPEKPRPR